MIHDLLERVPWHPVDRPHIVIPPRPAPTAYVRPPEDDRDLMPDHAATLTAQAEKP